ncbi:MAG: dihydrofolate reductase family protein [Vicinamibacterales bacterium]
MQRIRFSGAVSLDGFIAGPDHAADWIVPDPEMDFAAWAGQFDTLLVGRRTFEIMARAKRTTMPGMRTVVVSTTLQPADHPEVTILGEAVEDAVGAMRARTGTEKDVLLFGGAGLFGRLLAAGLVDAVEVAVQPVLLGSGIPLQPATPHRRALRLTGHRVSAVGVVRLEYAVAS